MCITACLPVACLPDPNLYSMWILPGCWLNCGEFTVPPGVSMEVKGLGTSSGCLRAREKKGKGQINPNTARAVHGMTSCPTGSVGTKPLGMPV